MRIAKFKLPMNDARIILDSIYYGGRAVADKIYPTHPTVYDEDAGVFTDYGMNKAAVMFAYTHFISLLGIAIIETNQIDDDHSEIVFLHESLGAVVQLLFVLWSDPELQKSIWTNRAAGLWESDGHYGSDPQEKFMTDMAAALSWKGKAAQ